MVDALVDGKYFSKKGHRLPCKVVPRLIYEEKVKISRTKFVNVIDGILYQRWYNIPSEYTKVVGFGINIPISIP